ncbi:thioredoxin family protein [Paenibacillus koleovorans]|uniref:thioredoxin family protein n=1 Tax=Paenibacillus koleovorans TaxID=121608 RepID=UPI000FD95663|nr:thioredoxin family protein [Paenibacillus koleovorans]
MKKLLLYLGIIVGLFVLLFIVNQQSEKSKQEARVGNLDAATKAKAEQLYGVEASKLKPETIKQLNDENYQNIIKPADLKKKIESKEETFVYFFSTTCIHCIATTPVLNPIAKEAGVDLKQLNLWEYEAEWANYKIEATPTLVVFRDGKEVTRLQGGVSHDGQQGLSPDNFKKFFTDNKKKS